MHYSIGDLCIESTYKNYDMEKKYKFGQQVPPRIELEPIGSKRAMTCNVLKKNGDDYIIELDARTEIRFPNEGAKTFVLPHKISITKLDEPLNKVLFGEIIQEAFTKTYDTLRQLMVNMNGGYSKDDCERMALIFMNENNSNLN